MAAPTNQEQLLLELINEARLSPMVNASRYIATYSPLHSNDPDINSALDFFNVNGTALQTAYQSLVPVQPVAWNNNLATAAHNHSAAMIDGDAQSHQLPGEPALDTRANNAGYTNWQALGENIFAFAESPLYAHAGFMVDWGNGPNGMQSPPGHRDNIMNSNFREIGISIINESDTATTVGPQVVTEDFGARFSSGAFVLGVAYTDTDANGFYSIGEGVGTLHTTIGSTSVTSAASGGYTLNTTATGAQTVTFTGAGLSSVLSVALNLASSSNVKLDVIGGNTLRTSTSVSVSGPISTLVGLGQSGLNLVVLGTGNQTIVGTPGSDTLNGGAGVDTASYANSLAAVKVSLALAAAQNTIGAGTDTLIGMENLAGGKFNDTLTGNSANNLLNGGLGNDTLSGAAGNDTYVLNSALDVVTETSNAGIDLVQSTATAYTLAANVDNLTLLGAASIAGTGNALNNVLAGNAGNNALNGGAGLDTASYALATAAVKVDLGLTTAQNTVGAGSDTLTSIERLTGGNFNDTLNGGSANDMLNGGVGNDSLSGGTGHDIYVVNSTLDIVKESLSAGSDTVQSTATSFTLPTNVENLTLLGTAAINGIGNTLNNLLNGNSASNVLSGGAGKDMLDGKAGNDRLTGGPGLDNFRFDTSPVANIDTLTDFTAVDDTMQLENSVFTSLATTGVLASGSFVMGTAASDANDFVIYNTGTGGLYYDADGNGAGLALQIAILSGAPTISAGDFLVT